MNNILLLEDLPEIRAWLKVLVKQVFPESQIHEAARVHDALELVNAVKFDLALWSTSACPTVRASTWSRRCANSSPNASRSS